MDVAKFQCLVCVSRPQFGTIGESVLHQKCHTNDRNFRFTCPTCSLQFQTFNALDLHVHYFHGDMRNIPQIEVVHQACIVPGCHESFPSSMLLCQHLKKHHQAFGVKTQCPFKSVCRSENYFTKQVFAVHLSQQHPGWRSTLPQENIAGAAVNIESVGNIEMDTAPTDTNDDTNVDISVHGGESDNSDKDVPRTDPLGEKLNRLRDEFYRSVAMLYLRLEALHLIPVSTIDILAQSLSQLSATNLLIMKEVMLKELSDLNLSENEREKIVNNVLSADCMFAAHHKATAGPTFTTNPLRKSYYKSHFQYIKPREINLSQDPNDRRCVYYCKIKNTLEMSLSNDDIREEIKASFTRESKDGIYEDYFDGSLHKKRKEKNPEKSIDLLVFQDEFAPTKDLSSVAGLHKILGMYYTIGNLRPHLRAKLDCKRLIMLIPDSKAMFTEFKVGIFKEPVKELLKLQRKGVRIDDEQLKVRLRFLLGDNKGQHELGGLIQSFSSEYFCRYCPMTKTEINAEPWKVAPLRTPESYERASQLVPAGRATYMGISRPEWLCPFNDLEDFHVCDPSLTPCVGHDMFLGVINYDLSLMIQYFVIQKKWFTYQQLNRKIRTFKYHGHDSGNKPPPVKYESKSKKNDSAKERKEPTLGGHAVQNWTLLRLLPFILDEEFIKDSNDPYWRLYVSLKEVTEGICVPSTTLLQIGRLKVMIENYLLERKDLLGDGKPKHHYFAHFADLMEILGPLIHFNGLGFEQFHQFFKNAAKSGKNFVDLGYSLIKKYCLYLAYLSAGAPFTTGVKIIDVGVSVAMYLANRHDKGFEAAIQSKNIADEASVMKSLQVDDLLFKEGQWLLLGNYSDSDDTKIVTGRIISMILDGKSVYFMLQRHVAKYLSDIGIYIVSPESCGLACISRSEVKYPLPQSMYEWGSHEVCFSLKHSLSYTAPQS